MQLGKNSLSYITTGNVWMNFDTFTFVVVVVFFFFFSRMFFSRTYQGQGEYSHNDIQSLLYRNRNNHYRNKMEPQHLSRKMTQRIYNVNGNGNGNEEIIPTSKKRKFSASSWENGRGYYQEYHRRENAPSTSNSFYSAPIRADQKLCLTGAKRDLEILDDDIVFMSRIEIERLSPSRKDGIDSLRETYLRYSYCAFLQNFGMRLELPQTTIGTAMVLCHRFFVRRSHASHDRFMVATAALFLAAKSEETARPLNDVLRASCEICHKQGLNFFPSLLPVDWFEQYRERVTDAEQMILTTLNFELNVQHPYDPLTSVLSKLGLSQTVLVNLALCLVSEGSSQTQCNQLYLLLPYVYEARHTGFRRLRSSLWLQFKPHHIAAGAAYLAAKILNFDLATHHGMWQEFQTTPSICQDVVKQLTELF
ncbi:hypothetical protein IFM89_002703 [Coptis chinensis]|uniref:Cyclin-like domain-containing protein n=1 Tax=Coptis chinensis TaxID=261450 RepID=A0A835M4H4_9MAGN|nr:hypothetical protein IFM89_002703 [Coptis chinensis]